MKLLPVWGKIREMMMLVGWLLLELLNKLTKDKDEYYDKNQYLASQNMVKDNKESHYLKPMIFMIKLTNSLSI